MCLEHRTVEQRKPHRIAALPAMRKSPPGRRVNIMVLAMPIVLDQVRCGFWYRVPRTKHRSGLDGGKDACPSVRVVTALPKMPSAHFLFTVTVSPISITIRSSPISSRPG